MPLLIIKAGQGHHYFDDESGSWKKTPEAGGVHPELARWRSDGGWGSGRRESPETHIPGKVYHASPYADKIVREGFKIDKRRQVLGGHGEYISTTDRENAHHYAHHLRAMVGAANGELSMHGLRRHFEERHGHGGGRAFEGALRSRMRRELDAHVKAGGKVPEGADPGDHSHPRTQAWLHHAAHHDLGLDGKKLSAHKVAERKWDVLKEAPHYHPDLRNGIPLVFGKAPHHLAGRRMADVKVVESKTAPGMQLRSPEGYAGRPKEGERRHVYDYNHHEKEWRVFHPHALSEHKIDHEPAVEKALATWESLFKAIDEKKMVQHEYERAHQRIHESNQAGGDPMSATIERIKGITNPYKLVGTHHAALDHGMGDAAHFAASELRRQHKRKVDSFPAPSRRMKPVEIKQSSPDEPRPKAPQPDKGQKRDEYVKTVFNHYRLMGRPHNQAWAIAHSTAERAEDSGHKFRKSFEEQTMTRPDLIGPRPLRPAQVDQSLVSYREERSRLVAQPDATPMIRKGMQGGVMPGAQPPRPEQPRLVLGDSLVVKGAIPFPFDLSKGTSARTFDHDAPRLQAPVGPENKRAFIQHHIDGMKHWHYRTLHEGTDFSRLRDQHKAQIKKHYGERMADNCELYAMHGGTHPVTYKKDRQAVGWHGDRYIYAKSQAATMAMPAASSNPTLQPQPARGESFPTQVMAQQWLKQASEGRR